MATYAIGDVQGCLQSLLSLLDRIDFDRARDRLWFVGDLVNRGPDSLGVLRLIRDLADCAVTVLGNHDLHLLAVAHDPTRRQKRGDTLREVLAAPDRSALLEWLRHRPLYHRDPALGFCMVHAGLPRQWSTVEVSALAHELESVLRGESFVSFLRMMYGDGPDDWDAGLPPDDRLRYLTNCFTRMRYCRTDGRLELKTKVGLTTPTPGLLPWFMLADRTRGPDTILFGHWSTLRLTREQEHKYNVIPLDTGAVWGGALTALRLEDGMRISVPGSRKSPRPLD